MTTHCGSRTRCSAAMNVYQGVLILSSQDTMPSQACDAVNARLGTLASCKKNATCSMVLMAVKLALNSFDAYEGPL